MTITVIVTSHNEAEHLATAIESVLAQTHRPDEVLLVDVCSTDGSRDIIDTYAGEYPNLVKSVLVDENISIPAMRNLALERVTGDLVTFLDGDDRFRPAKLERELATYEANESAGIVFSNIAFIDGSGEEIGKWATERPPPTGDMLVETLARDWPTGNLFRAELISRNLLLSVGGYDERFPIYEDWELRIRLAAATEGAYTGATLVEYRRADEGISTKTGYDTHARVIRQLLDKHRSLIDRLQKSQRTRVLNKMRAMIHRCEALNNAKQGRRLGALRSYGHSVKCNHNELTNVRTLCRVLLPERFYRLGRRIYRDLARGANR